MIGILDEAKELLAKWEEKKPKLQQNWDQRRMANIDSWESTRPVIMTNVLQRYAVQTTNCHQCSNQQAAIRCHDCQTKTLLCSNCDLTVHSECPFHDRQGVINGFYQAIPPTVAIDSLSATLVSISKFSKCIYN